MPLKSYAFELRTEGGVANVYAIRWESRDIPKNAQRPVFTWKDRAKAQVICDALNNGLLMRITLAVAPPRIQEEIEAGPPRGYHVPETPKE